MKVYQDLVFRGDPERLVDLISEIERRLSAGWERRFDLEKQVGRRALGPMYCFSCAATSTRPDAQLWIVTGSEGELRVSTILSNRGTSLTYDQYNAILTEFYSGFADPAARRLGIAVELSGPEIHLETWLSPRAADLLRSFSKFADKYILLPSDRKRWHMFLAQAHRERTTLDPRILKRWLIEEEKWSESLAYELTTDYEHARGLLEVFESQKAG
jgi:hypothetical protein